ncbi:SGNH/GDSL hydrolase family protein [Sinomicrobium weinanense]|uniref:SGNH/GDSL hydrolase family protein n=1 Tax=Sinomicrobium weinanense TaxID=2842200 RepID=A0A926Q3V8_9FLAO|nr:SGNH/GDSL hydrolase family protein [Sinomicrobium weinanense]MBC9796421.1 SGNH/GDSL hydrolase family protein [Sinomicrobium weinanense]MBU3125905.1 SGNH/GDSL hydrolase family protein [Sinomicrobium weinanense]
MKLSSTTCLLFFLLAYSSFAQELKPFEDGDRAVFLGNSITHAGFYESYIWLYYMTHFPDRKVYVLNGGSGGDVVGQMNARFEDDILPMDPNIVILTFGMNDSGYLGTDHPETAIRSVKKSYHDFGLIQEKLKSHPEITPVIMSSSPYDETQRAQDKVFKEKTEIMKKITDLQEKAAEKNHWAYVDLFHPMMEMNLKQQQKDPTYSILGEGRVHPGPGGYLIMASLFLKNQGLAGKPIADVIVDAQNSEIEKSENANVYLLDAGPDKVSFGYKAKSLPFPLDSTESTWGNPQKLRDAFIVYPFTAEFNRELLRIKNLKQGNYKLVIDGEKIAEFPSDSLNKGINMAMFTNTPQYKQAMNVMFLNKQRKEIEGKLREYYWVQSNYFRDKGMLYEDSQRAYDMASREKEGFVGSKMGVYRTARFPEVRKMWENNQETLIDKIYEINKPKLHKIEIIPVAAK